MASQRFLILTFLAILTYFVPSMAFLLIVGAAETIVLNKTFPNSIIIKGEKDVIAEYSSSKFSADNALIAADLVTEVGEDGNTVDGRGATEALAGVLLDYAVRADKKASYSIGVTVAATKLMKVLRPTGGRVTLQLVLFRNTTTSAEIEIGTNLYGSVTNGNQVTNIFNTTNGSQFFVGKAAENIATSATANKLILVRY